MCTHSTPNGGLLYAGCTRFCRPQANAQGAPFFSSAGQVGIHVGGWKSMHCTTPSSFVGFRDSVLGRQPDPRDLLVRWTLPGSSPVRRVGDFDAYGAHARPGFPAVGCPGERIDNSIVVRTRQVQLRVQRIAGQQFRVVDFMTPKSGNGVDAGPSYEVVACDVGMLWTRRW